MPRVGRARRPLPTRTRCASSARAPRSAPMRPTFTDSARCLPATRPETLIVMHARRHARRHHRRRRSRRASTCITEKPMATTAEMCRRILDAERRTGRRVDVTFNYRFSPTARSDQGTAPLGRDRRDRLGRFPLVSRCPARRRLFPPLARLREAFRQPLRPQGDAPFRPAELVPRPRTRRRSLRAARCATTDDDGPFRGPRCKICEHADICDYYIDIGSDPWLDMLYEDALARGRLFSRRMRVPRGDRHPRHDERGDPLRERRAGLLFAEHLHADRGLSPRLQRHEAAASRSASTSGRPGRCRTRTRFW